MSERDKIYGFPVKSVIDPALDSTAASDKPSVAPEGTKSGTRHVKVFTVNDGTNANRWLTPDVAVAAACLQSVIAFNEGLTDTALGLFSEDTAGTDEFWLGLVIADTKGEQTDGTMTVGEFPADDDATVSQQRTYSGSVADAKLSLVTNGISLVGAGRRHDILLRPGESNYANLPDNEPLGPFDKSKLPSVMAIDAWFVLDWFQQSADAA
ncbi:hypothetical protein Q5752_005901 [Cryptotrichosporon argae]